MYLWYLIEQLNIHLSVSPLCELIEPINCGASRDLLRNRLHYIYVIRGVYTYIYFHLKFYLFFRSRDKQFAIYFADNPILASTDAGYQIAPRYAKMTPRNHVRAIYTTLDTMPKSTPIWPHPRPLRIGVILDTRALKLHPPA